jgi:hypothetical protein
MMPTMMQATASTSMEVPFFPKRKIVGPYKAEDYGGIYIIGLFVDGKLVRSQQYIGQTTLATIEERIMEHFRDAYNPSHKSRNTLFYQAIRKAGLLNNCNGRNMFCYCPLFRAYDRLELDILETACIHVRGTHVFGDPGGLNTYNGPGWHKYLTNLKNGCPSVVTDVVLHDIEDLLEIENWHPIPTASEVMSPHICVPIKEGITMLTNMVPE